jgi:hypothetical protein
VAEADTCRAYIIPSLHAAGWEDDSIVEQLVLTPGRIVPVAYLNGLQAQVAEVGVLQEASAQELRLRTRMPSIFDEAFKCEIVGRGTGCRPHPACTLKGRKGEGWGE